MLKLKQKKLDGIVLGYDRKPNEVITQDVSTRTFLLVLNHM